ncbi:hypothetical protein [Photobacterium galatheae]|uniref:Uncharacterized protein n=1 Tax=Photobacterium galatheae TaxID=1654360 RepID=A0A066RUJ1_9GAMM|nr:hypothetical protein [Photobacterium galatheae]KDM91053.1 hypothetical protein EA58_15030 [Photobacterium galatheae]MCM0148995.1 hypothetical protein [Photobacterium galatheae]
MNFKNPTLYGYGVADNSCVDECLSAIDSDNQIFNRSSFDSKSFNMVFESVCKSFEDADTSASLAVIGLISFAIKNQIHLQDIHLCAYAKAKQIDPLAHTEERAFAISSLDNQLLSFLLDQRVLLDDYCK